MCDPNDQFTTEHRLCDDDGMVSGEYLTLLNNLRSHAHPGCSPVVEAFVCTSHAHLAGEHIRCTSPAHEVDHRDHATGIKGLVSRVTRLDEHGRLPSTP